MNTLQICSGGIIACTAIYLFATAPAPLPEAGANEGGRTLDARAMFDAVNEVNNAARAIYTGQIVGPGIAAGLAFGEDWQEPGVQKGPLPALFLRLTASQMETHRTPLSLYLGSDAPIAPSNQFTGAQAEAFVKVRATRAAVHLGTDGGAVAMYPDFASAGPCVSCHNEHENSPKKDWVLNDVMGATTWTFPTEQVGAATYLEATESFFRSVEAAYALYLEKAAAFDPPVEIGNRWPAEGVRALPDVKTFMDAVRERAAGPVLEDLILVTAKIERGSK